MLFPTPLQTLSEFKPLYNDAVNSDINKNIGIREYVNNPFQYSYHCHEATLSFAYALNKTISGKCFTYTTSNTMIGVFESLRSL